MAPDYEKDTRWLALQRRNSWPSHRTESAEFGEFNRVSVTDSRPTIEFEHQIQAETSKITFERTISNDEPDERAHFLGSTEPLLRL